jgi:hypothetical protein
MLIRGVPFSGDRTMKTLAVACLLLQTTFLIGAPDKLNPADFTVGVHVISSGSYEICGGGTCTNFQVLETVIDNQPIELQSPAGGVLKLGDYRARLVASYRSPKHPNGYDVYQAYDLLMPDGTKRTYTVTRFGPAPSHP